MNVEKVSVRSMSSLGPTGDPDIVASALSELDLSHNKIAAEEDL